MLKQCRYLLFLAVLLTTTIMVSCDANTLTTEPKRSTSNSKQPQTDSLYLEPSKALWVFPAERDHYSNSALLDLSYLNTPITGPSQRVVLSADKNSFALASGQTIRFWAINLTGSKLSADQIDDQIRFLAKRGVNMVRLHEFINPKGDNTNLNDVDREVLEQTFRYVAALKKYGVYLTYSPYWANTVSRSGWAKAMGKNWPVPKNPQAENFNNLLFFDPTLGAAYKNWLRILLTETNPYTGQTLKDDPTFAILQLQNEDSLLFWTFNGLRGEDLDTLRLQYGHWLTRKYGTLQVA